MDKIKDFLAGMDPFRALPAAELGWLASIAQTCEHAKGETVFSEGDEATSVWILSEGRIQILKYTSDGKPRTIEVINPRDLYGTLCRIGGAGQSYPCTAVAAVDSISLRIPDSVFLDLFRRYQCMVTGVCTLCSSRLVMMQELTCTSQEPVEKRIVRTLFQLSNTHGNTLPYTKRQIGEMAATTVETTIRTLSQFQKKKWIASSRGTITLKNTHQLESLLKN
jgi:CRP-like cAMP-binding protein